MAGLAERAHASGEVISGDMAQDDVPFDLLKALAVESDPRTEKILDLLRRRGWTHWIRAERLPGPPG